MRLAAVILLGVTLAGCSHTREVVGGPVAPPAKPEYQPYVPTKLAHDDFVVAAGSNTVLFATNSAFLDSVARETLDRQAAWIITHRDVPVLIEGHADHRASTRYNLELGRRRARAVVQYFVSKGIDPSRFVARSYGEGKPIIDEPGDVQINRRAVTVVLNERPTDAALGSGLPAPEGVDH